MRLRCVECRAHLEAMPPSMEHACGGLLEADVGHPKLPAGWRDRALSVWKYKEFLPHHAARPLVSLNEGGTPLIEAPRIAEELRLKKVWLKIEGQNPTGSFKDRGMTCAVSWSAGEGAKVAACASTGNTAASMAAYAARAGMRAIVLLPAGNVAMGKVAQSLAHGAEVLEVEGSFDDAMALVLRWGETGRVALLNSKNPLRLEGQKTLMWEVLDQLGHVPDRVVYPVGNAGNISAGHKALVEWREARLVTQMPRLTGVQSTGASPIATAVRSGNAVAPIANPETLATAIRIGNPVSAAKALRAIKETDGTAVAVPDSSITEAQADLARQGVFCEPASAASFAGLRALAAQGEVDKNEEVVLVLTGHGLKDPGSAERLAVAKPRKLRGHSLAEVLA